MDKTFQNHYSFGQVVNTNVFDFQMFITKATYYVLLQGNRIKEFRL